MAKRSRKPQKGRTGAQEYVVVTFAENMEQAKDYETLLKNSDIPALIREQVEEPVGAKGIAVMVPEEFLDEAHVVIESQEAYDDFCDFASDRNDEDEFADLFEGDDEDY